ncbi:hypothetical protein V491_02326 [Pseudogymnoascus sp. VKM F-3775]|nr:hypothetical protein V491_02326 [Pseudogymnoascus sp. VKM F-3775]
MFGTWRSNSKGGGATFMRRSSIVIKACNNCRAKKLKCTGQLSGCSRCESLDIRCIYADARGGKGAGQERNAPGAVGQVDGDRSQQQSIHASQPAQGSEQRTASPPSMETQDTAEPPQSSAQPVQWLRSESDGDDIMNVQSLNVMTDTSSNGGQNSSAFPDKHDALGPSDNDSCSPMDAAQWSTFSPSILDTTCMSQPGFLSDDLIFCDMGIPHLNFTTNSQNPLSGLVPASEGMNHTDMNWGSLSSEVGSRLEPTAVGIISQSTCDCSKRIIFLIDELESRLTCGAVQELDDLDSALSSHKEALGYGKGLLSCSRCSAQHENKILLSLLANQLVMLCDCVVSTYLNAMRSWDDACQYKTFFGEYEVDSAMEWDVLLKNLIVLQLSALYSFVRDMRGPEQAQEARSLATVKKIKCLGQRLQQKTFISNE